MRDKDYLMDEPFGEDEEWPEWYDGKHINEALFCQYFLQLHPMKCIHGRLFTVDGKEHFPHGKFEKYSGNHSCILF